MLTSEIAYIAPCNEMRAADDGPSSITDRDIAMTPPSIVKMFVLLLGAVLLRNAVADEPVLDRAALQRTLPGNTIRFEGGGDVVDQYLAPDGTIHGRSKLHGAFAARWRLHEADLICFETDDPMQSGCVAVVMKGAKIEFHRRDGVIEGPFDFIRGNPAGL